MEYVLKNTAKYKNIKLARGLILDLQKTKNRFGRTGISTKTYGKRWFCLEKGKAIFKTYDGKYYLEIRNNRIINEFICNEMLKQVGILAPHIEPASLKDISGLVTYNISSKSQKLISAANLLKKAGFASKNNNLKTYKTAMEVLKKKGYSVDIEKEMVNLYKIAIFDVITMQTDRHANNLYFLLDKKTKRITVAPLIDNEFAFFGQGLPKIIERGSIDIKRVMMPAYAKFAKTIGIYGNDNIYYNEPETDVVIYSINNKKNTQVLKEVIKNIDPQKAINNVRKLGYEIPKEYEFYIVRIINTTKEIIIQQYEYFSDNTNKESTKKEMNEEIVF